MREVFLQYQKILLQEKLPQLQQHWPNAAVGSEIETQRRLSYLMPLLLLLTLWQLLHYLHQIHLHHLFLPLSATKAKKDSQQSIQLWTAVDHAAIQRHKRAIAAA